MNDLSLFVAGAAGEGIQTIGDIVARAFLHHGYPVFATSEFESRIRGGNSSTRLRIGENSLNAPRPDADVLLALNSAARDHYAQDLREGGLLIADEAEGDRSVVIPFSDLAVQHGGAKIYGNAVAAGALAASIGLPFQRLERLLRKAFQERGEEVVRSNVAAARSGHELALNQLGERAPTLIPAREARHVFASAHSVIPIAAAAAGCRFIAAYPMSPSTGIITTFAHNHDLGVFVEQAEDEISAINMAIGASAAGARAMTATSGGGFALMTEALSLAGMTETPIVVLIAQRPGPATGLPTRTAQEDLLFAIHGGHGEFPRLVLAPSDPQDAAAKTVRAFDLADRFQIPVILLTDQYLADSHFSLTDLEIPPEPFVSRLANPNTFDDYARYALTKDGVSPRLVYGQSEHIVSIDSDEHTEEGHITEDLETIRPSMVEKRQKKTKHLRGVVEPPRQSNVEDAEIVLVGWGSTRGAIEEAAKGLRGTGHAVGTIHFTELWPLPVDLAFPKNSAYWAIEGNATAQFAGLLEQETSVRFSGTIGRSDGRPIDASFILEALQ